MTVYFIGAYHEDKGLPFAVKIGFTERTASARCAELQSETGQSARLRVLMEVPGSRETEATLHQYFADIRRRGEWFDFAEGNPLHKLIVSLINLQQGQEVLQAITGHLLNHPDAPVNETFTVIQLLRQHEGRIVYGDDL